MECTAAQKAGVTCHFWFRFAFCYLNFCFASRFFLKFSLNFAFCLDYNTTVEYEYQGVVQFCLSPIHVQYSQCSHAKLVGHAILSKKNLHCCRGHIHLLSF